MENLAQYSSKRSSLSFVGLDCIYFVSAIGVLPNGELDHDREIFSKEYTDKDTATRVYNKLRAVLYACDVHAHYPMPAVIKQYAEEAAAAVH